MGSKAYIPGGARSWLDALPRGLHDNPDVYLTLVPNDAHWKEIEHDGCRIGYIEMPYSKELLGLQVLAPAVNDWTGHVTRIRKAGYKMARAVYIGPLEAVPQSVLMHEGMCAVIVLRRDMSRRFFNLRGWAMMASALSMSN